MLSYTSEKVSGLVRLYVVFDQPVSQSVQIQWEVILNGFEIPVKGTMQAQSMEALIDELGGITSLYWTVFVKGE